jgi:opacity protein-like surface antigen
MGGVSGSLSCTAARRRGVDKVKGIEMKRVLGAAMIAACVIAPVVTAGPAAAEGDWYSYLSNVKAGFDSRSWDDRDNDNNPTTITLNGCTISGHPELAPNVIVRLWRERTGPDQKVGVDKSFACRTSATKSWGHVPAGSYHFEILKVNNSNDLQVSTSRPYGVEVYY